MFTGLKAVKASATGKARVNPHPRGRGKTASRGLPNTPWSCVRKKYEASSSLERPEESGESGMKSEVAGQHTARPLLCPAPTGPCCLSHNIPSCWVWCAWWLSMERGVIPCPVVKTELWRSRWRSRRESMWSEPL